MDYFNGQDFPAQQAWSGPEVASIPNAVVKLRWTDKPYRWHVNHGQEVFVVLDGEVEMHVRNDGDVTVVRLRAGDILHIGDGDEHVAIPRGPARILVVEQLFST